MSWKSVLVVPLYTYSWGGGLFLYKRVLRNERFNFFCETYPVVGCKTHYSLSLQQSTDSIGRPVLVLLQGKILRNSGDKKGKNVWLKLLASSIKSRLWNSCLVLWDLVSHNARLICFIFAQSGFYLTFQMPLPKFYYVVLFQKILNLDVFSYYSC